MFARCDQAGDHAPWDRLAAWQRPEPRRGPDDSAADEIAVLDLGRLAEASDVGAGTVERLKLALDELATAYPVRRRVTCSAGCGATSATSADCWTPARRSPSTAACWSWAAGCPCWPPRRRSTCTAITPPRRSTCAPPGSLPVKPGTRRSPPGCMENPAWQVLATRITGRPVDITHAAQRIAPESGSVFIQATAQEGRAWARLGAGPETRAALSRVEALVSPP